MSRPYFRFNFRFVALSATESTVLLSCCCVYADSLCVYKYADEGCEQVARAGCAGTTRNTATRDPLARGARGPARARAAPRARPG